MSIMRNTLLWASTNRWMAEHVPRLGFVQRAVRKFMPGESVEDAAAAAQRLSGYGLATTFTALGENVADLGDAEREVKHYLDVLDLIAERGLRTEISVKLTHLGLDLDRNAAEQNLTTLLERAASRGTWVWVDMESFPYVDVTLDIYRRARTDFANAGLCLQTYLHRTPADLQSLLPMQPGIRLVKGAYKESPDVALQSKRDVDQRFLALAGVLAQATRNGTRAVLGTHDVELVGHLDTMMAATGIDPSAYEIHMLYGIRTDQQIALAAAGRPVSTLISYGSGWYPWYVRRLAEKPSNVLFVLKNLLGSPAV